MDGETPCANSHVSSLVRCALWGEEPEFLRREKRGIAAAWCDLEAGMAKLYATEAALENSLEAMRIHGAYGYSKEFNIERYYRDAPLLAIGEGTNELQRIIIARELVKRNPA